MTDFNYKLVRSNRKTIAIEVNPEGLVVRAPHMASKAAIENFINTNSAWIEKRLKKMEEAAPSGPEDMLTMEDIKALAQQAKELIPGRVAFYAEKIGVTYGRITIRNQRSRWGSCSTNGNLNFNCLLMLMPPEVVDSIVVHELCHRKEMNHSDRFYAEVLRVCPDYYKWYKWLKDNGPAIMRRMTG